LVLANKHPVYKEGQGDTCCRDLGQGYSQENHAPEHEVRSYQRAKTPDEHAAKEGLAQEKVWTENLDERVHSVSRSGPKISMIRSGASMISVAPLLAQPSSTQATECTRERTSRRWWLTSTTVRPWSRCKAATRSM